MTIFHIARRADWVAAMEAGEYRISTLGRTLAEEGFIHCSYREQVAGVLERYYGDEPDLVLLEIDPTLVDVEVKVETPPGAVEAFPHIYGPLEVSAVVAVRPL